MSIIKAAKISINGSTNAFGGYVYSASFNHEYGPSPSTLTLSIVSKSREYLTVQLSSTIPYIIEFDTEIRLKMYAVSWDITDGTDGKVLSVEMIDGRFTMDRKWVALSDFPCARNHPDIIFLGDSFNPSSSQVGQNTQTPIGTSPVLTSVSKPVDGQQLFLSYTYDQLRENSTTIKLPEIPGSSPLLRLNSESTLSQVFSEFCKAYGYNWYWDYDNDRPILLDLRKDVDLDPTLYEQLRGLHCMKSISYGESIRDLRAQGVVFYNNSTGDTGDAPPSGPIFPVYNIFSKSQLFLSHALFGEEDLEAAQFAVWGEEIYIKYLFDKYPYDFTKIFGILGYELLDDSAYDKMTADQQDSVSRFSTSDAFLSKVRFIRCRDKNLDNTAKAAHFRMAAAITAGQVGWMLTPYPITATNCEATEVSRNTLISQVPGIGNFLKTDITKFDSFNNRDTVGSRTTNHLYVVTFPKLKFTFNGNGESPTKGPIAVNGVLQMQYTQVSDGKAFTPNADENDSFFMVWGTPNPVPKPRVDGIVGYVVGADPNPLANPTTLANSYSSKYKDALCNIPVLNDLVTSFSVESLTNDGVESPMAVVANSQILPTVPHRKFALEVYGINTGLSLTPQKGLDSFRITMGDNGYETNYVLSSKARIPLDNKIVKQLYI